MHVAEASDVKTVSITRITTSDRDSIFPLDGTNLKDKICFDNFILSYSTTCFIISHKHREHGTGTCWCCAVWWP